MLLAGHFLYLGVAPLRAIGVAILEGGVPSRFEVDLALLEDGVPIRLVEKERVILGQKVSSVMIKYIYIYIYLYIYILQLLFRRIFPLIFGCF